MLQLPCNCEEGQWMARSNKCVLQQDGYLVWVLFMFLHHIDKMRQKGEEPTRNPGQLEITYITVPPDENYP
jgi:hypothetical protein